MASNKLSLLVRHGCLTRVLQKSSNPLIKPNHQTGRNIYVFKYLCLTQRSRTKDSERLKELNFL